MFLAQSTIPAPYPGSGGEFPEIGNGIKGILDYLVSPQVQQDFFWLKIVFIIVSVLFLFAIIYFLTKSDYLTWAIAEDAKNFLSPKSVAKKKIEKQWEKVKREIGKAEIDAQWKLALIDGLEIFNEGLRQSGFVGKTLRERVGAISVEKMPEKDELMGVLPTCENIISDPGYFVSKKNTEKIIEIFENILKKLEVF